MAFDMDKGKSSNSNGNNSGSSSHSTDDGSEYDYHPRLYRTPNAVIEGDLGELKLLSHDQYGDSIVYNIENVEMLEGAMYEREDNNGKFRKIKMFGFDDLGYPDFNLDEHNISDLPDRWTENYFGENYIFHFMSGVYGDAVEGDIEFDNLRIQEGTSKRTDDSGKSFTGPTASSKRSIKLLAEHGTNALNAENLEQKSGWVDDSLSMASDLQGRRVQIWTTREPTGDTDENGDPYMYNLLNMYDKEADKPLPVRNVAQESGSTDGRSLEEVLDEDESDDANDEPDFSEAVLEVIEWAKAKQLSDRDDILEALQEPVSKGFINESEINGQRDAVVDEIQAGA
jgi:hypothetical protein